jgi:hypothetical protein
LSQRGSDDSLAESLEAGAIAAVDHLLGVNVDPTYLGHGLVGVGGAGDAVRSVFGEDEAERGPDRARNPRLVGNRLAEIGCTICAAFGDMTREPER